jgi:hypothetical protein
VFFGDAIREFEVADLLTTQQVRRELDKYVA